MRRLPSLTALRFFEESARHTSFNKSASVLCVTPGAVSRQIRLLEDALGTKLFERDHLGVRLTHQGDELLTCVSEALDSIERTTSLLRTRQCTHPTRLTVCAPPTFATRWLPPRLGSLMEALPDIALAIRTDAGSEGHCSIHFDRHASAHAKAELLFMERHVVVGAPHFAGESVPSLLDRLPPLHVLHNNTRLMLWPNWLEAAQIPGARAEHGIEFSTLDQAIHSARAGTGLAVVDLHMIHDELREGSLTQLSPVALNGPYGYWLEPAPAHAESHCVRHFAAWLRQHGTPADTPPIITRSWPD